LESNRARPPAKAAGEWKSLRCGCQLSKYRSPLESRCAPCQLAEPAPAPATRAIGTAPRIVLLALEAGPLAARDIATQTGLCQPTVKDVLRRLREQGQVTTGGPYKRPLYQLAGRAALAEQAYASAAKSRS
jgi:hypothetical protein